MEFNLSEEQEMIRVSAEHFLRDLYPLEHRRRVADSVGIDVKTWEHFADLGWLMLPFDEEAGGLGGGPEDITMLMDLFGRGLVLEPYVTTVLLCGAVLAASGADESVTAIMDGTLRVAFAHDEEAGPPTPGALPRTVAMTDGNDGYRLTGQKRTVLDAPHAHQLLVSADLGGEFALFIVDAQAPGLRIDGYKLIDGSRAADVLLSSVPASVCLNARGEEATRLVALAIDRAKLACLAQSVGGIEAVLDLCSEYLKTREQFGRPIGQFQALQHIMAGMFVEAQEARSILYWAIAAMRADPSARATAIAQAKVVIGQAGQYVSRQGLQLHGGYGMTEEFAVGHHFKRLLTLEKMFGDVDLHLADLAARSVTALEASA